MTNNAHKKKKSVQCVCVLVGYFFHNFQMHTRLTTYIVIIYIYSHTCRNRYEIIYHNVRVYKIKIKIFNEQTNEWLAHKPRDWFS